MIDIEALVTEFLKAETGERVVGEIPSDTSDAWVKLVVLDGRDATRPVDHLNNFMLQLDCYAGTPGPAGQGEAQAVASTVREFLLTMPSETFIDAVVTNVIVRGPRRIPDTEFKPARQRYILEVEIDVHS